MAPVHKSGELSFLFGGAFRVIIESRVSNFPRSENFTLFSFFLLYSCEGQCAAMLPFCHFLVLLSFSWVGLAASNSSLGIDRLAAQALGKLKEYSARTGNLSSNGCTFANAVKRRDW
jgi:hypothetical protein